MKLREEFGREQRRWSASTLYQNFERVVVYLLTGLIAVVVATATWRLVLTVMALVSADRMDPSQYEVFQGVFGAMFTVLIALEFRHSMWVTLHSDRSVVQVRSVVLIALLALVLYPIVWLILLPFRIVGIAVGGVLAFLRGLFFLPARILRGPHAI